MAEIDSKKARVVLLVQARMGATRLPGKPLKLIMGRPMLSYQIERLKRVRGVDQIVLATTTQPGDLSLVQFCEETSLSYFRGSEEDVLERFLQAAYAYRAEVIVRSTADCPLIDPEIVDQLIALFFKEKRDYVTNSPDCGFPRGLDAEVFSMASFEKIAKAAIKPEEREHVTPYYYRHPEQFNLGKLMNGCNLSHYRLTVDTVEDFLLIRTILEELYPKNPHFSFSDLLQLLQKHPEWIKINENVKQKELDR